MAVRRQIAQKAQVNRIRRIQAQPVDFKLVHPRAHRVE